MTPEERVAEIRSQYDKTPWTKMSDVQFLLDRLDEADATIRRMLTTLNEAMRKAEGNEKLRAVAEVEEAAYYAETGMMPEGTEET